MITFIAPMYKETWEPYMFMGSLLSQTSDNWKAIIYMNGDNLEKRTELNSFIYNNGLNEDKIRIVYTKEDTGCWGAKNRNHAIKELVDTEYIINSSIQDYWIPTAVETLLKIDTDFIYWNSINHIFGYHGVLNCEPVVGRIDWGNFCIRTNIAKVVGINHPNEFCGDGYFVKDCIDSGLIKTIKKIPQILTIHN